MVATMLRSVFVAAMPVLDAIEHLAQSHWTAIETERKQKFGKTSDENVIDIFSKQKKETILFGKNSLKRSLLEKLTFYPYSAKFRTNSKVCKRRQINSPDGNFCKNHLTMASAIDGVRDVVHVDDELDAKLAKMATVADDEYAESPDEILTNDLRSSMYFVHTRLIPSPEFANDFDVDRRPTMHYVSLAYVDLVHVEQLKLKKWNKLEYKITLSTQTTTQNIPS